jgi:hypothetical protein
MLLSTIILYYQFIENEIPYKEWLTLEERQRRDRRVPRCALRPYKYSSFQYLYISGDQQALINATGHDHQSFNALLQLFGPTYKYWTFEDCTGKIRRKILDINGEPLGRQRDMPAVGCLGLVLTWYRTRGSCARALVMIFGQTSTPMYKWIKFGRRILLHVLSRSSIAKVKLPTENEVVTMQDAAFDKYPSCGDVWGAGDGLNLLIAPPVSYGKQVRFYNRWKIGHHVKLLFVFGVDGKIRIAVINGPGSFHDSALADYKYYQELEYLYDAYETKIVVDSAFKINDGSYLVKSSQEDPFDINDLVRNREAISIRQLSE